MALNAIGTDFSLMVKLFPNRSRRDLKKKFQKEERASRPLVDKAISKFSRTGICVRLFAWAA